MISLAPILRFNMLPDTQLISVPEGFIQYQGHRIYTYPSYDGLKSGLFDYYAAIGQINGWHPSILNEIMYSVIDDVIPIKQDIDNGG